MTFGPLVRDTGKRIVKDEAYYLVSLGAPTFDAITAKRIGRIIERCLPTQRSPAYWNVPDDVDPHCHSPIVVCHPERFSRKTHPFAAFIFDSSSGIMYHLCKGALHHVLALSHLVTEHKAWLGDTKRRKNMKAPEPKAQEFADLDTWRNHGADKRDVPFVITGEPSRGDYGYVFPVLIDGKEATNISLREDSKKYLKLYKKLGDDFAAWVNRPLTARIEEIKAGKFEGEDQLVIGT